MTQLRTILDDVMEFVFDVEYGNYTSNTNPDARRMVAFANRAVNNIMEAHDWSQLRKTHTVTVVDGTTLYDLPSDFRRMISDTAFRPSSYRPVMLPSNDQFFAYAKTRSAYFEFMGRLVGDQVELINTPAGDVSFDYVSNGSITSADTSQPTAKFTNDNDVWNLDDELLKRGVIAVYSRQSGDESAALNTGDYTYWLERMKAQDVGARVINDVQVRYKDYPIYKNRNEFS